MMPTSTAAIGRAPIATAATATGAHNNSCTQQQLHTATAAHSNSCTQQQLHTSTDAHSNSCTQQQLHAAMATQSNSCHRYCNHCFTQPLSPQPLLQQQHPHTSTVTHNNSIKQEQLLQQQLNKHIDRASIMDNCLKGWRDETSLYWPA